MNTRSNTDKDEVEKTYRAAINPTPLRRPRDTQTQSPKHTSTPFAPREQQITPSTSTAPTALVSNFNDPIIHGILSDSPLPASAFEASAPPQTIAIPVSPIPEEPTEESLVAQEDSFCGDPTQYASLDSSIYSFRLVVTDTKSDTVTNIENCSGGIAEKILKSQDNLFNLEQNTRDSKMNDNSTHSKNSFVTLQYAVETVPFFDGQNMPIEEFIARCRMARAMIPPETEVYLTKIIHARLTGEARRSTQDQEFTQIGQLTNFLKSIFGSTETLLQLQSELGRNYQRAEESVLMYANRAKELGRRILEAHRVDNNGTIDHSYRNSLERDLVRSFIKGLKPEIEQRIARNLDINVTMGEASRIEKELRDINEIRGTWNSLNPSNFCHFCKKPGHSTEKCRSLIQAVAKPNLGTEILICQICKKRGHSADKCRFRDSTTQNPVKVVQSSTVTCQICFKSGHVAQNCRFINNQTNIICHNCQKPGHMARECRSNIYSKNEINCQICGKSGHHARNCYPDTNHGANYSNEICQWCGRRGHQALQCRDRQTVNSNPPGGNTRIICQACNKAGHTARDCRGNRPSNPRVNQTPQDSLDQCRYCKAVGHRIEDCVLREESNRRRQGNQQGSPTAGASRASHENLRSVMTARTKNTATETP